MGISTKHVTLSPFAQVTPHTASRAEWIGQALPVDRFARGQHVEAERVEETGEVIVTRADGAFIHGALRESNPFA